MSSDSELAMVFVLRNEHTPDGHVAQEDAVDAAVRGMLMILSDRRPAVVAAVEHWVAGRFTKIVKRAHGRLWERVVELDEPLKVRAVVGTADMLVFAPIARADQPPALRAAHVSGLQLESASRASIETGLPVYVNDSLNMTTGKLIAQVCHAVQTFVSIHPRRTALWLEAGGHISLVRGIPNGNHSVMIVDAGQTEVRPGSVTVAID
ncbi:hypothetical protein F8O06_05450 [Pseudoclavibacter sp. CFCC 14310]|uniref:aminoacyl-tRNA hydrolase n=1 Tax=Pseudoclavibacter sp. CFCC 14310 TaxID=2615180 RepID=UPI0013014307|nr:aminoacyl-tRNA hydrolase [Pseudoclavibacter sp. CFCC 14310]KAB1646210.1 hypothetical protein F8O06_05450 [Pseudoclavibacter sp. CFCC 14310]